MSTGIDKLHRKCHNWFGTERRIQLSQRQAVITAIGGFVGVLVLPFAPVKLICMMFVLLGLSQVRDSRLLGAFGTVGLCLLFAANFVLTPVDIYQYEGRWLSFGLAGIGIIWTVLAVGKARVRRIGRFTPSMATFIIAVIVVGLVCLPGLYTDLSDGGDELYHLTSAELHRAQLSGLLTNWQGWLLILSCALPFLSLHPRFRQYRAFIILAPVLILIAAALCGPLLATNAWGQINRPFQVTRASRYPSVQAWLSAIISFVDALVRGGKRSYMVPLPTVRLLPLLSVAALLFVLAGRRESRRHPFLFGGAALCILTIPVLWYHASVLYLDVPVVVAYTFVLIHLPLFLHAKPQNLRKHPAWWGLLAIAFLKETAVPILAMTITMRFAIQFWKNRNSGLFTSIAKEAALAILAAFPAGLYLLFRLLEGSRPYGHNYMEIINLKVLIDTTIPLLRQIGPVLAIAIFGFFLLLRRGGRHSVLAIGLLASFLGMRLFFLADHIEFATLGRFNLYLLPPVLALALAGLAYLSKWPRLTAAVICMMLIGNFMLRPIELTGQHKPVGFAHDRWYPYDRCVKDILTASKPTHVASCGPTHESAFYAVLLSHTGFDEPKYTQYKAIPEMPEDRYIRAVLYQCQKNDIPVLVHISQRTIPAFARNKQLGPYHLVNIYPSPYGHLLLFTKSATHPDTTISPAE